MQDVPAVAPGGNAGAGYPGDWPDNGVFVSRWEAATNLPKVQVGNDFISRGDGVTSTLLLSENIEARNYEDCFAFVGAAGQLGSSSQPVSEQMTCLVWYPQDPLPTTRQQSQINGQPSGSVNPSPGIASDISYARPSSAHPGGANFAFCDGHVQFLSDSMDYLTYTLLLTPHGANARKPGAGGAIPTAFVNTPAERRADTAMTNQFARLALVRPNSGPGLCWLGFASPRAIAPRRHKGRLQGLRRPCERITIGRWEEAERFHLVCDKAVKNPCVLT